MNHTLRDQVMAKKIQEMSIQQIEQFVRECISIPQGSDTMKVYGLSPVRFRVNFYASIQNKQTRLLQAHITNSQLWLVYEKTDGSLGMVQWKDDDTRNEQQILAQFKKKPKKPQTP